MADLWMDVDAALSEAPVNILSLIDDTDFKTREEAVVYDAAGLELIWHFTTTTGATTATVVTPTTGGDYDWAHQDGGMYTIEMTASGGASANNDTEGFGWFTGVADGVLPWRGPVIGFRAAGLNNLLIDDAFSATRGLTGTALPAVAAGTANTGLPLGKQGYNAMLDTTVDTVTSQTEFILTAGSGDNNAYLNGVAVFFDADGDQSFRDITSSTGGGTPTIVIDAAPDFTVVATDNVRIYPSAGAATAAEIRDSILDRVLSGNHDTAGTVGRLVQVLLGLSARTNNSDLNDLLNVADTSGIDLRSRLLNTARPATPVTDSVFDDVKATRNKLPSGNIAGDGDVTAIKAITDQLTFTVANQVDSNPKSTGVLTVEIADVRDFAWALQKLLPSQVIRRAPIGRDR